jgi:alkanesulfonate monooxygenase SsuD/methylene tetrahydromethanopterin reductase-like flavin-dependent oxidoreductase (luciferase family)
MHRVDGPYVDAWIALAAIAARIGPLITPLPRRRPWKLAREAVSLDHLSHGRVVLGVGIGTDHSREFSAFGEPSDVRTRAELLDEGLDIVTQLWTGEPVHSSGRNFHVDGARFSPVHSSNPTFPSGAAPTGPTARPFGEPPATTASSPSTTSRPKTSQTS